jgi:predicted RNA-binding protein with PIN domain
MIIIIDGYNVLKQALHTTDVPRSAKERFVAQVGIYAKKKGHAIVVVFDGGDYEWPDRLRVNGVTVVHSGIYDSADEWIKKYVHNHKGHELLLVSTDRALAKSVRSAGASSIDAMDFYVLLRQEGPQASHKADKSANKAVKTTDQESKELDELMLHEKVVHAKLDDILGHRPTRKSTSYEPSKKDKKLLKKLNKL